MPGMRKPLILLASRILGIPFAVKLGIILHFAANCKHYFGKNYCQIQKNVL